MSSPSRAPLTLRRAGAASALMVGSALLAHVAAGGTLPPPSVLAVLLSMLSLVGVVAAGGVAGRWTSLALVGGSQFVVHELLVLTSGWSAYSLAGGRAGCGGHAQAALLECAGATGHAAPSVPWAGEVNVRMLLLHAVATVTTGWLLAVGDRIGAHALAAVRPLWQVPVMPAQLVGPPITRWVEHVPRRSAVSLVVVERQPRRGPPRVGGVAPLVLA